MFESGGRKENEQRIKERRSHHLEPVHARSLDCLRRTPRRPEGGLQFVRTLACSESGQHDHNARARTKGEERLHNPANVDHPPCGKGQDGCADSQTRRHKPTGKTSTVRKPLDRRIDRTAVDKSGTYAYAQAVPNIEHADGLCKGRERITCRNGRTAEGDRKLRTESVIDEAPRKHQKRRDTGRQTENRRQFRRLHDFTRDRRQLRGQRSREYAPNIERPRTEINQAEKEQTKPPLPPDPCNHIRFFEFHFNVCT